MRLKNLCVLNTKCSSLAERPYIALEHLENHSGCLKKGIQLHSRKPVSGSTCSVKPGDILFGKLRPNLAKSWLADCEALASTELLCLRPNKNINAKWLSYLVRSRHLIEWAIASSDGAKMPRTSWEKLGNYRVHTLPSVRIQQHIADYLDKETNCIDALISKKCQLIDLLEARRFAMISAVVKGKDGVSSGMRLGDLSIVPIRRVFHIVHGGTPTADPVNWGDDIAWATPIDLAKCNGGKISASQRSLTVSGLRSGSNSVPAGSLIVSSRAPIGYVVETTCPMAFNQGCKGLVPTQDVDIRFFRYQISVIGERLNSLGQGSTFLELSTDALASSQITVPPLPVQQGLSDYLDIKTNRIDTAISKERRIIKLFRERRQTLITAVVTGEISVPGSADTSSTATSMNITTKG